MPDHFAAWGELVTNAPPEEDPFSAWEPEQEAPTPPNSEVAPIERETSGEDYFAVWGTSKEGQPKQEQEALPIEPDSREPAWEAAPEKTLLQKGAERLKGAFKSSPEDSKARASNIYALSKEKDMSLSDAEENYDVLISGLRDQPRTEELIGGLFSAPIIMGLMTNPITTLAGLSGFMALDEAENFAISKMNKNEYHPLSGKGLKELAPADLSDNSKFVLDMLDLIGKGALVGGAVKGVKHKLSSQQLGLEVLQASKETKPGESVGAALRRKLKGLEGEEKAAAFKDICSQNRQRRESRSR